MEPGKCEYTVQEPKQTLTVMSTASDLHINTDGSVTVNRLLHGNFGDSLIPGG
jgi:hypothetical protein